MSQTYTSSRPPPSQSVPNYISTMLPHSRGMNPQNPIISHHYQRLVASPAPSISPSASNNFYAQTNSRSPHSSTPIPTSSPLSNRPQSCSLAKLQQLANGLGTLFNFTFKTNYNYFKILIF